MSKGLSFAGLMDLGTLHALKVSTAKAASNSKEKIKETESSVKESKERADISPSKEPVFTYPQPC